MIKTAMEAGNVDSGSSSSSISADEDFSFGLQGYQFEPHRSDSENASDQSVSSETDEETEPEHDRMGNVAWCQCHRCSYVRLIGERECLCCQESQPARTLAVPTNTGTWKVKK